MVCVHFMLVVSYLFLVNGMQLVNMKIKRPIDGEYFNFYKAFVAFLTSNFKTGMNFLWVLNH